MTKESRERWAAGPAQEAAAEDCEDESSYETAKKEAEEEAEDEREGFDAMEVKEDADVVEASVTTLTSRKYRIAYQKRKHAAVEE